MPELKRTFTGGKMDKDLDERILPNGEYREALNISVATSEDSDVGAAQNILGNTRVTSATSSTTYNKENRTFGDEHVGSNFYIAEIVDTQTDMLYRFVHTPNQSFGLWVDRIVEYDTSKGLKVPWQQKEHAIMVDVFKVKAEILAHSCVCLGSNKSEITISTSKVNYLRWGMLVTVEPGEGKGILPSEGVTIENINYSTGVLSLSKPVFITLNPPGPPICNDNTGVGSTITFTGDRNLNFSPDNAITGINIIDGMIFWTDNYSEPKKVNIRRGKIGSISQSYGGSREFDGVLASYIGRQNQDKIDDFNQHTLLIVDDGLKEDCLKNEAFCPIIGCTDPLAWNFNPLALYDDGSCCEIAGCTDNSLITDKNGLNPGDSGYIDTYYCNYNEDANCDDGSCATDACGCTDPLAFNWDVAATMDDGSCEYCGCMDDGAQNYNALAVCDDGSCTYTYDCVVQGYTSDSCATPGGMISAGNTGNTDLYDPLNWYDAIAGPNYRGVMNWFSETANANKKYGEHYFLYKLNLGFNPYVLWTGTMISNTLCDYQIDQILYPNQYIRKLILAEMYTLGKGFPTHVNGLDTPGFPTAQEVTGQMALGNPTYISLQYNPNRAIRIWPGTGTPPQLDPNDANNPNSGWGADIAVETHYEFVEACRAQIWDGNYTCWTDATMTATQPVPEITHAMTFQDIYDIVSNSGAYAGTIWYFGPNVNGEHGAGFDYRVLPDNCGPCTGYTGTSTSCQPVPGGQYSSLSNCNTHCNTPIPS